MFPFFQRIYSAYRRRWIAAGLALLLLLTVFLTVLITGQADRVARIQYCLNHPGWYMTLQNNADLQPVRTDFYDGELVCFTFSAYNWVYQVSLIPADNSIQIYDSDSGQIRRYVNGVLQSIRILESPRHYPYHTHLWGTPHAHFGSVTPSFDHTVRSVEECEELAALLAAGNREEVEARSRRVIPLPQLDWLPGVRYLVD